MNNFQDYIQAFKDKYGAIGWILVYSHDRVVLDKFPDFPNSSNTIDLTSIKEARIFNTDGELKVWTSKGKIKERYFDKEDLKFVSFPDQMVLWGNKVNHNVLIEKDRGIEIKLPIEITQDELPLTIHVDNYFEYNRDGLIVFKDARLVKITNNLNKEV
jgi:CRISPR-associated protein (TIGR03984 family)